MVDSCSEEAEARFMEPITAPREVLTQPTVPRSLGGGSSGFQWRSKIREDKIVARLTAGDDDGVRATCDEAGDDDREAAKRRRRGRRTTGAATATATVAGAR